MISSLLLSLLPLLVPAAAMRGEPGLLLAKHAPASVVAAPGLSGSGGAAPGI